MDIACAALEPSLSGTGTWLAVVQCCFITCKKSSQFFCSFSSFSDNLCYCDEELSSPTQLADLERGAEACSGDGFWLLVSTVGLSRIDMSLLMWMRDAFSSYLDGLIIILGLVTRSSSESSVYSLRSWPLCSNVKFVKKNVQMCELRYSRNSNSSSYWSV